MWIYTKYVVFHRNTVFHEYAISWKQTINYRGTRETQMKRAERNINRGLKYFWPH